MAQISPFSGVNDRVKLADHVPLNTPFTLNLFPSNRCNFRCHYCIQSQQEKGIYAQYLQENHMSEEILEKVIVQAAQFNTRFKLVSFMGHGEPLCHPNLPEFIRKVKAAQIAERVDIITNGSLLTEQLSEQLIEAGLDVLRISLQGIHAEAYRKTCGVAIDFEQFLHTLHYFYERKKQCKVYVKIMDVSLDKGEECQFYEMFSHISDRMYIDQVKPVYEGVAYSESMRKLATDRYGNYHEKRIVCPLPFYMLSVWPNGDVTPCDAIYKASCLGNVSEDTLLAMWNSKRLHQFCQFQLQGKRFTEGNCQPCCAPDDVTQKEDVLDEHRLQLLEIYKKRESGK